MTQRYWINKKKEKEVFRNNRHTEKEWTQIEKKDNPERLKNKEVLNKDKAREKRMGERLNKKVLNKHKERMGETVEVEVLNKHKDREKRMGERLVVEVFNKHKERKKRMGERLDVEVYWINAKIGKREWWKD